jgi:UDP-glucose 4-epimerase
VQSILITGGAGYIGRALTRACLSAGHGVTVLDDLSNSDLSGVAPKAAFVQADVADCEAISLVLHRRSIDLVIHLAARTRIGESFASPDLYMAKNVEATRRLIETVVEAGPRPFLFASTAAVYGDAKSTPVREDGPTAPTSPYGLSKLMAENLLRDAAARFGFPWLAVRYFNVAGGERSLLNAAPSQDQTLFPAARAVAEGKSLRLSIYGRDHPTVDGACVRDYIHIADLVRAQLGLIQRLGRGEISGTVNLGTGYGASVLDVVTAFERRIGRALPLREAPARPGEAAHVVADMGKLKSWLPDWRPQESDLDSLAASELGLYRNPKAKGSDAFLHRTLRGLKSNQAQR